MRRREFAIVLGGAAVWPLATVAQRLVLRTVGVLGAGSLETARASFAPVQSRLTEIGYVEGRNLTIEYRWADDQESRLASLAGDLVQHRVDAIVVFSGPAIVAAKAATTSIPIIFFTGFDPVASGFVASLNRPGGNVTGVSALNTLVIAKRLQMLCELVPSAKSIGYLYSPSKLVSGQDQVMTDLQAAAGALDVKLTPVEVWRSDDLEDAFARIAGFPSDALLLSADAFIFGSRSVLVRLAAQYRIPTAYPVRSFAADGGLLSYGTNYSEAFRQLGSYLGLVLNGEKPQELPVQQITKLELVINMKTARTLGLAVPVSLLARADEVIE